MPSAAVARPDPTSRLSFWLLTAFLVVLWVAGGSSRADVAGQGVVRLFAWAMLISFTIFSAGFEWRRVKPVAILLIVTVLLVAIQLVPLPPTVWAVLPGRGLLTQAAFLSGQPQPWRPLSISPGATWNALGSLVVPTTILVLCAQLNREQHWRIAAIIVSLTFAGCVLALLQFSGANYGNPLINYPSGDVSGNFANRNHFALFVAMGCLIAPAWGFRSYSDFRWKAISAIALLPFFLLVALATGSRAGILLVALAIATGLFLVRGKLMYYMRTLPRWLSAMTVLIAALAIAGSVVLSFTLGRAASIDRALDLGAAEDLRIKVLPYVIDALVHYFPVGTGFGTFDPVYRIGEPDALLQAKYFNHAHNDWLEVILDGGLAAVALVGAVLAWAAYTGFQAWRRVGEGAALGRIGSIVLLLVVLSSVTDYPARTPLIMAMIVIAAVWLHLGSRSEGFASRA